jgi:hypothetical protein
VGIVLSRLFVVAFHPALCGGTGRQAHREYSVPLKEDPRMNSITASGGLLPTWMSSGVAHQVASNTRHHVEEWQQAWQALSPTDQAALTQAGQQAVHTLQSLTPQ